MEAAAALPPAFHVLPTGKSRPPEPKPKELVGLPGSVEQREAAILAADRMQAQLRAAEQRAALAGAQGQSVPFPDSSAPAGFGERGYL